MEAFYILVLFFQNKQNHTFTLGHDGVWWNCMCRVIYLTRKSRWDQKPLFQERPGKGSSHAHVYKMYEQTKAHTQLTPGKQTLWITQRYEFFEVRGFLEIIPGPWCCEGDESFTVTHCTALICFDITYFIQFMSPPMSASRFIQS